MCSILIAGKRAQTLTNPAPQAAVAAAPQQQLPAVTILPRQTQVSNELVVSAPTPPAATPLLGSPVESPRRSIILQPPMADVLQQPPSFVFAQVGFTRIKYSFLLIKQIFFMHVDSPLLCHPSRLQLRTQYHQVHYCRIW